MCSPWAWCRKDLLRYAQVRPAVNALLLRRPVARHTHRRRFRRRTEVTRKAEEKINEKWSLIVRRKQLSGELMLARQIKRSTMAA